MQHKAQAQECADSFVEGWKPADERLPLHGNIEDNAPEFYLSTVEKVENRNIFQKQRFSCNIYKWRSN